MSARPLRILIASDHRRTLRRLSTFLEVFGYDVRQAAGQAQVAAALRAAPPDCLILDAGDRLSQWIPWCGELRERLRHNYVPMLVLADEPNPALLAEALAAGVDDFLARPIVYGEVLARLRTAARTVEFERRLRQQTDVEPATGLPSRAAFLERLAAWLREDGARPAACVLLDVDFLAGIDRNHGRAAAETLMQAVGKRLAAAPEPAECIASLGSGRFAILLAGASQEEAAAWADRVRAAVAQDEFTLGETAVHVTLSGGVVPLRADLSAEQILEQAVAALRMAKQSGRDVVVCAGQFAEETRAWNEFLARGQLFEGTIARDIMTPCALVLAEDDSWQRAQSLFARSRLEILPVVDAQGRLVGVLSSAALVTASDAERSSMRPRDMMETSPLARDEETPFDQLMGLFHEQPAARLVIVRDGRPTGLVTANHLLALSVPLDRESFPSPASFSTASDYLLVPDLSVAEEG